MRYFLLSFFYCSSILVAQEKTIPISCIENQLVHAVSVEIMKAAYKKINNYLPEDRSKIILSKPLNQLSFSLEKIVYLGLILNEILSIFVQNFASHDKKITVESSQTHLEVLIVASQTFPEYKMFWEGFEEGKHILDVLIKQLKGKYEFYNNDAFHFKIEVPI